jgi:hypothetical protein
MSQVEGSGIARAEDESPPSVFFAVLAAYALAGGLVLFGFIGFLISAAIGNSVGLGALVLGIIVGLSARVASRGNSIGRAVIGLGSAATAVVGVIYAFVGPGSAVIPSLVIAAMAAGTFALLYLSSSAKRFYAAH